MIKLLTWAVHGILSLKGLVNHVCQTAFYHLRNIYHIHNYFSKEETEIMVNVCITLRLDYCTSLLVGLPEYLLNNPQLVQNAAARVYTDIIQV